MRRFTLLEIFGMISTCFIVDYHRRLKPQQRLWVPRKAREPERG